METYCLFYRALRQERPMILSVILTKATPYIQVVYEHGVATISRLLQRTNLFCKRALSKRRFFAKETFNFKEPTNRSHPTSQQQCFVISSAEYRLFYRALLQKRPIILRSPLIVATSEQQCFVISFAEYSLYYRALLQKRPIIFRSLLIVAVLYYQ